MVLILVFSLASCGTSEDSPEDQNTVIYCLDSDGNGLSSEDYTPVSENAKDEIKEFLKEIVAGPKDKTLQKLLPEDLTIVSSNFSDGTVTLDFNTAYGEMKNTREVLVRAGIVRTLSQIDGVEHVIFTIAGKEITNSEGEKIGPMNADSFIENSGRQINTYQHTSVNLYFSTEDGKNLVRESRSIYYSSNKPLEWAVVERLISGPKVSGNYATIPSNTQIISVATSDGICYVNLSASFMDEALNVDERIPIYSIVDSLISTCGVKSVQFAIEGETDVTFRTDMKLSKPYTADMSLIKS